MRLKCMLCFNLHNDWRQNWVFNVSGKVPFKKKKDTDPVPHLWSHSILYCAIKVFYSQHGAQTLFSHNTHIVIYKPLFVFV